MNLGLMAAWVATALGTGAASNWVSGFLNRRKTQAETVRTGAEAVKVKAEALKIEAEADAVRDEHAEHVIAILRAQVDRQQAQLDRQQAELAAVRAECEAHRALDRAELAAVKAANAGLTRRLDELTRTCTAPRQEMDDETSEEHHP